MDYNDNYSEQEIYDYRQLEHDQMRQYYEKIMRDAKRCLEEQNNRIEELEWELAKKLEEPDNIMEDIQIREEEKPEEVFPYDMEQQIHKIQGKMERQRDIITLLQKDVHDKEQSIGQYEIQLTKATEILKKMKRQLEEERSARLELESFAAQYSVPEQEKEKTQPKQEDTLTRMRKILDELEQYDY